MSLLNTGLAELPILLVGGFGLGLIIERVRALFFEYRVDAKTFMDRIEGLIFENRVEEAIRYCASQRGGHIPRVVEAGLLRAGWEDAQILNAVEMSSKEAVADVNKRVGYLAMIANVATLLGLLGTIYGLIKSFKAIADADAATKQTLLADGISTAMNHTAMGLAVAIPTMIAFSFLTGRAHKISEEIENAGNRVFDALSTRVFKKSQMKEAQEKEGEQGKDASDSEVPNGKASNYSENEDKVVPLKKEVG